MISGEGEVGGGESLCTPRYNHRHYPRGGFVHRVRPTGKLRGLARGEGERKRTSINRVSSTPHSVGVDGEMKLLVLLHVLYKQIKRGVGAAY